ncbi:MAG TPA: Rid family detoxifying hydrolase [Gemmatimonadota bacterium]|nr:Rid family detoxifying hydrolase [Gemmatimonadota bacterium]
MPKRAIETDRAPQPAGAYSQGIESGELIFTAGQIGKDPATGEIPGSIEAQTTRAIENVQAVLEAAGSGLDRVVKTTVFLSDMDDFAAYNTVYAEFLPEPRPARSTIGAHLPDGILIEIEAIATRR